MAQPDLSISGSTPSPVSRAPAVIDESTDGAIAFFLPSLVGGGAERVIVNLAQGIIERGIRVDLVLAAAEGALLDQLPSAARLVDLRAPRVLRSLVPLARYLRRERPRVLISSMGHANLVALWAAKLAGGSTPVVVTEHNTLSQETRHERRLSGRLWPHLLRTFYPWATTVVAVSRGAADDLARTSGLPRDRVEVVYNPVITPTMLSLARQAPDHPWFAPGQPPVILGVGRLTRQKDFFTLLRAFAEVRRQRTCAWSSWGKERIDSRWRPSHANSAWPTPWRFPGSTRTLWPSWRARRSSCSPLPGKDCPRSSSRRSRRELG